MKRLFERLATECLMVSTRETLFRESTVHARMFAPFVGVMEDPATGSAAGALGAYLVKHGLISGDPVAEIIVEQGHEIGRPSTIYVEVEAGHAGPERIRVGGQAVEVAEGVVRF
jgi:trans-2,3-dihydro-3-hydroxyanthranilate isomerase